MKTLPELEKLDLSYSNVTDKVIPYINELTTLRELNLSNTQITDEGFSKLALPNLRILNVDNTAISERSNRDLMGVRCPQLEMMSIGNTPLHDEAQKKSKNVTEKQSE